MSSCTCSEYPLISCFNDWCADMGPQMAPAGQPPMQHMCPPGPMYPAGGPEAMDDGMQMGGPLGPDQLPPSMADQMLKHAVCNLINYQVSRKTFSFFVVSDVGLH